MCFELRPDVEMSFTVFLILPLLAGYLPTRSSTLNGVRESNYAQQANKDYNIAHTTTMARLYD
jgi:hypothetical protein